MASYEDFKKQNLALRALDWTTKGAIEGAGNVLSKYSPTGIIARNVAPSINMAAQTGVNLARPTVEAGIENLVPGGAEFIKKRNDERALAAIPFTDLTAQQSESYRGTPGGGSMPDAPAAVGTDTEMPSMNPSGGVPASLAMPQYRTTPAEWQHGQRTIQKATPLDAEAGKLINRGQEQQMSAAELQTLTEVEKAKETAAISEQRASFEEARAAEVRSRAAEVQAKTAEKMNHINALASEVENGKVDPSHYFTSQSTGAKLATMLSVVLGAGAAQRINGRNVGLDMMNDAVARDIDAQKAAIDSKRAGLSAQQNIYGQMLQTFGREDAAKEAAHIVGLTAIKAKLDAQIAKYGASDAANKGLAVSGQLAEQIGAKKQDLAAATTDHETVTDVWKPAQTYQVGGGAGGGTGAAVGFSGGNEIDEDKFVDEGNGRGFIVGTSKQKEALQESSAASKEIQSIIAEAVKKREKLFSTESLNPLVKASIMNDLKQLQARANSRVNVFTGMGAMSNGDKANTIDDVQDMTSFSPGATERLRSSGQMYDSVHKRRVAEAGGRLVEYGYGQVPASKTKPAHDARLYKLTGKSTSDAPEPAEQVKVQPIKVGK